MNVVEPILFQCKLNPMALAICVPGSPHGPVSYGTLGHYIESVAAVAAESGIKPGDLVAIYTSDTVLHAALVLGLMHLGARTLSLRGPRVPQGIAPDVLLTDVPGQISGEATILALDRSWLERGGAGRAIRHADGTDDDTCRIILTSGSTGTAKGVALSHRAMLDRTMSYATARGTRFAHCPRFFCDLSLSTSPGTHYLMALLGRGATIYFLGAEPADILQVLTLHNIKGMATSPYGLGEFLKFFETDGAFDTVLDHVICQGAKLSPELAVRARARLSQNIYVSYGATETSTVAFGPASLVERTPGAVGYIQPGATVEVVDQAGKILPAATNGHVRIRSGAMAAGYVGDPGATEMMFRDGYFYTGDLGQITEDGLLIINGRDKALLNVGGDIVSPERVEDALVSFPGIREAGVFAADNELGIAELRALVVVDHPIDIAALRRHCAGRLPPSCTVIDVLVTDALPRGAQGKLERHRLSEVATHPSGFSIAAGDATHV